MKYGVLGYLVIGAFLLALWASAHRFEVIATEALHKQPAATETSDKTHITE